VCLCAVLAGVAAGLVIGLAAWVPGRIRVVTVAPVSGFDSSASRGVDRSWLGLRVVRSGFGGGFVSGLVLSPAAWVRIARGWFRIAGCGRLLVPGPVLGWVAGPVFLDGSPGVPGPGGEPFPQRDDLMLAEPYLSERPVVHPVQMQPGIGEVLAGQARIQPPRQADQLGHAVAVQRRGHVRVIPRLGSTGPAR
jgi:hypothetical protein